MFVRNNDGLNRPLIELTAEHVEWLCACLLPLECPACGSSGVPAVRFKQAFWPTVLDLLMSGF